MLRLFSNDVGMLLKSSVEQLKQSYQYLPVDLINFRVVSIDITTPTVCSIPFLKYLSLFRCFCGITKIQDSSRLTRFNLSFPI